MSHRDISNEGVTTYVFAANSEKLSLNYPQNPVLSEAFFFFFFFPEQLIQAEIAVKCSFLSLQYIRHQSITSYINQGLPNIFFEVWFFH